MKRNVDKLAKQILRKRKDWPVTEIKASGKPGWDGGAYTIAFIYSNRGNFILKGFYREVREHLKSLTDDGLRWFGNLTLWHHYMGSGGHRSIWDFWKDRVCVFEPSKSRSKRSKWTSKWKIIKYSNKSYDSVMEETLEFKRLPQKWIPEFDKL